MLINKQTQPKLTARILFIPVVCPQDTYGTDCGQRCDCVNSSCAPDTGECQCPAGKTGPRCDEG